MAVPYQIVTLDELITLVDYSKPVMFDTETIGFYGTIRLAQFYQEDWDKALMVEYPDVHLMAPFLQRMHLVAHNASYDFSTIQRQLGMKKWKPNTFDDTLLLARLHYFDMQEFTLDKCMIKAIGEDVYASIGDKKALQKSDWSKPELTDEQLQYAAADVYYLPYVYNAVKAQKNSNSYFLDITTLHHCLNYQTNGVPLDINRCWAKKEELEKAISQAEIEFEATYNMKLNVNSPKQVKDFLGRASSDAETLANCIKEGGDVAKRAEYVKEVRHKRKLLTYADKYLEVLLNGRVYGIFAPLARSGRLTCKEENIQQVASTMKSMFGFQTDEGKVFGYADFSQLELRCIAAITGDERMCQIYRNWEDIHDFTAVMLFGEGFTKDQRKIAKCANFALLYGASAETFAKMLLQMSGLVLTPADAQVVKRKWLNLYTSVAKWQQQGTRDWTANRASSTPLGRRYFGKLLTDHLNIENQGFGAEVAKLAEHYMEIEFEKYNAQHPEADAKMFFTIHDSYGFECINDPVHYRAIGTIVGRCMQYAWVEMSKLVKVKDIPMPVDVCIGYNWGDIEDGQMIEKIELKEVA